MILTKNMILLYHDLCKNLKIIIEISYKNMNRIFYICILYMFNTYM